MAKNQEYNRLPGRGRPFFTLVSHSIFTLWMGEDHLLSIKSTGYEDIYKRFYYRDIQAITMHKSINGIVWNIVWGVLTLLFFGFGAEGGGSVWVGFNWMMCATFFVAMIINIARGPTCVCHIRTAAQTEKLPSLNRIRTAQKAIRIIKSMILETQGDLDESVNREPQ